MSFLSYWDIFGVVLITLYFILSWLYPKPTQEKAEEKVEKKLYSSSYEREDWKTERGTNGATSEAFIDRKSRIPEFVSCTSQSSPFGDAQAECAPQEVNNSNKLDSSSEKNTEKTLLSFHASETGVPPSEKAIASSESLESIQDARHASNTLNELSFDTSLKFPELAVSPEEISLSLSEIPEEENKELVSSLNDLEDDEKDVPKPTQYEELSSNSNMEFIKNSDDEDVEGLPAIDVYGAASLISDFSDNLTISSSEAHSPGEIETTAIKSCNAEEISKEVVAEAENSIDLQSAPPEIPSSFPSSVQKEDNFDKFADDLASTAIETAVDNTICLSTFAENLSEKIFSDSADDVILEVQACLEKQKKEAQMPKKSEVNELESLGSCVANEVVNEAVGEAALSKGYVEDEQLVMTPVQEVQPHIGFVVENVVNTAICEATSKLKRDWAEEATAPVSDSNSITETRELFYKSNESEITDNNNDEAADKCVILPDKQLLKDKEKVLVDEEGSKLESEVPSEFDKPLIEDLSVEPFTKDVYKPDDKLVEEQQAEQLNETVHQQFVENVSEPSFEESAETENNKVTAEEAKIDEETPIKSIPNKSHGLKEETREDETTISTHVDDLPPSENPPLENNFLHASDEDNNLEIPKDKLDKLIDKEEDSVLVIPQIEFTVDKDDTILNREVEEEASALNSPEVAPQNSVTLRNKDPKNESDKEGFWRKSLILDLEEDVEFEESISSEPYDVTSPDLTSEKHEISIHPDEDSEYFSDSEEDEIIDHDAEARLGAVGGVSEEITDQPKDDKFDLYDYEEYSDDDDNIKAFEPVFSVDGLCVSRQQENEKKSKLKSVGSHYNRAVVLDNGCGMIKLGYAGDRVPRVIQQNVTGMPKRFSMHITAMENNLKDYKKYGNEAVAKAGVMQLNHPMKAGLIESWTDIEEIWEYLLFEELGAEVGDNPVLITEVSQNSRKNREKIAERLFEHLNVPAMYLADQLPLSLYASGMTSGVCLSSGYSCTQAAVVYEGHTLAYTVQQLDIGGGDLTENLKIHLRDVRARNFTTSSGWQIVNDIKEKLAFVAKDYDHDIDKYKKNDSLTQYYKLPDGQMVEIGYESMACVEPLFQPDTLMSANSTTASQQPVHKLIDSAIKRCDPDLHDLCHKSVVLSGGTTLLKGFTSRLQHDLQRINRRIRKIKSPEHRRYSPWIGGSILASLPSFEEQWVTVDDYSESGAQVVHRKCF